MYMTKAEQKAQDKIYRDLLKAMESETEEQKAEHRKLLKGFLAENEQNSSKGTSSSPSDSKPSANRKPRDIVEAVMLKHGFSREKALEELEAFGW
ncbi:MAG: hypothetical protein GX672_08640 [Synergistaceae bacterium]|nr:hypothetical protein [Synergistaceae bacterium]